MRFLKNHISDDLKEDSEVVVVVTCAVVGFQAVILNGRDNELFNQIYFQIA